MIFFKTVKKTESMRQLHSETFAKKETIYLQMTVPGSSALIQFIVPLV